jgi:hypothetical protein
MGAMQSEDFGANQVVSRRKTGGKVDGEETLVLDECIDAPSVGLGVVAILPDLEPARTSSLGGEHIVDLLDIYSTGTLVALGNGTSVASTGTHTELEGQASTTGSRTDIVDGCVSEAAFEGVSVEYGTLVWGKRLTASHIIAVNGVDRSIGTRRALAVPIRRLANTGPITLVLAIDEESGKESMGVRNGGEAEDGGEELHSCCR